MTLKEQLNQQLSHIQQRTKGDNAGVVTMSAQDCDALFDMAMKLLDCVEALEFYSSDCEALTALREAIERGK